MSLKISCKNCASGSRALPAWGESFLFLWKRPSCPSPKRESKTESTESSDSLDFFSVMLSAHYLRLSPISIYTNFACGAEVSVAVSPSKSIDKAQ